MHSFIVQRIMKERRRESHAKRVCGALEGLQCRLLLPLWLFATVAFYASSSAPYYWSVYTVAFYDDCEVHSDVEMGLISQFYHLHDAYYIKVLGLDRKSGTFRVCVLKGLSTNTSIVFDHVPAEESPLCNHNLRPECLQSLYIHDNYIGLSLLYPNQSNVTYLILDTGANKVYRKNLTDQPKHVRDICADMIPGYRTFYGLGLACVIVFYSINVICYVQCLFPLSCICLNCCKR